MDYYYLQRQTIYFDNFLLNCMNFHFNLLAPIYNRLIKQRYPKELMENLDFNGEGKLLEIGGGTGRFAAYFLDKVHEVIIIEPAEKMLRQIHISYPEIEAIKGYAEELPFDDNSIDYVIVSDAFHHWSKQLDGLKEAYRVLKKDGFIAMEEIHPRTNWGRLIRWMEKLALMGSVFYTPEELMNLFSEVGFEIINNDWTRSPTYFVIARK